MQRASDFKLSLAMIHHSVLLLLQTAEGSDFGLSFTTIYHAVLLLLETAEGP